MNGRVASVENVESDSKRTSAWSKSRSAAVFWRIVCATVWAAQEAWQHPTKIQNNSGLPQGPAVRSVVT
jgi:hypothetical protein